MEWWAAALWGMAGGGAIELIDLYKLTRTDDGGYGLPEVGANFWLAYVVAVAIRLTLGLATGWALVDQLNGSWAAMGVGAGATGILEHAWRPSRQS